MKYFRITNRADGTDVFGAALSERNAYVAAYPKPAPGQQHPLQLAIGESSRCLYGLSGSQGTYTVTRIEDRDD